MKPEIRPLELRDGGIRSLCIPLFGLAIPLATGLYGSFGIGQPAFWLGQLWFILVSSAIWHGNRYLYLRQRQSNDWFRHPARRIVQMLAAIVFYTVPVSTGMLWTWYWFSGLPVDWVAIRLATATSVICVIFITHVYETVYLIQQRESDMVTFEKLERAKVQAELEALKNQLDPHFMFNSLNALSWLIENDPARAVAFNDNLADVYRYILHNRDRSLVSLEDELDFLSRYCALLKLRFEEAFRMEIPADRTAFANVYLPPISLQILLENAVKHNEFSRTEPLVVTLRIENDAVVMENDIRPKKHPRPSPGVGLQNLSERVRLTLRQDVEIQKGPTRFSVRIPLKSLDAVSDRRGRAAGA
ncbi:MAG: histidine kinase [Acidobacteria bacterium]|nr:histidine kinase [Acidobacteriota bacterium]